MCSYALRNERNKKKKLEEIPLMIAFTRDVLPILLIRSSVYMINSLNEWMIGISEWIRLCVGMYFEIKQKKKKDEEIASCMYVYVCLFAMIDLRSIQSMCGEIWRRVYWYISRGTSYLDIDTHHTGEDKKNCNRVEYLFLVLSLSLSLLVRLSS